MRPIKSGPLTNQEIEELDAFLLSDDDLENAMDVSSLDGFLCAVGRCSWLMRDVCSLIWLAVIGLFRSRASLQVEILTLRHQLNVLRRKSPPSEIKFDQRPESAHGARS